MRIFDAFVYFVPGNKNQTVFCGRNIFFEKALRKSPLIYCNQPWVFERA